MTRSRRALFLPCALLACALPACDRAPAPASRPEPESVAASFDNEAAEQSIVRPEVIAETEPAPVAAAGGSPAPPPGATVAFASGSTLDDAARTVLDRLIADPALPPDARFVVRGHTDALGDDRANLLASRRRAEAVRDYLAAKGVAPGRVEVVALGERRPVAPNATLDGADDPAGRARNRRADVTVLPADPSPSPVPGPDPSSNGAD